MSKRARDSGGGDEDDEAFDPMAFYKQQQAAMLSQAAQHVEQSREEISRAQQVKEKRRGEYSSLLDHSGDLMKIGWRGDFGSIWRGDFGRVFFWTF